MSARPSIKLSFKHFAGAVILFTVVLTGLILVKMDSEPSLKGGVVNSAAVSTEQSTSLIKGDGEAKEKPKRVYRKIQDAALTDLDGRQFRLHDYKGKWIILHFWATWCGPCRQEFPDLVEFMRKQEGKAVLITIANDLEVVDIGQFMRRQPEAVQAFYDSGKMTVTLDPNQDIGNGVYHVQNLPETMIISPELDIVQKIPGAARWSKLPANIFDMPY